MRDRPDPYVLLGVEPTATLAEIQSAYRRRIQVVHPDRFDRATAPEAWTDANDMLRELNEAYRTLSNARLRREYDLNHAGRTGPVAASAHKPSESPQPAQRTETAGRSGIELGRVAILLGVGLLVLWVVLADSDRQRAIDEFFQSQPRTSSAASVPAAALPAVSRGCEPGVEPGVLPPGGSVWRYDTSTPLAPLEVRVKGQEQYLVKLERDGILVATLLVRAGSTAEVLMPLGEYTLKYATGSGDYWCGEDARFPFGRETGHHIAGETFSFRREAGRYTGHAVELFLQRDGNFRPTPLSPKAW
jgi:hypothetical protein